MPSAVELKLDDAPEQRLDRLEALLAMGTSRIQVVAPLFAALLSSPFEGRYPPLTFSPTQQRRQTLAALLDPTVERIRYLPILAILTFKPEFESAWSGLPNVTVSTLGRLDQSRVITMVEEVAGGRCFRGFGA